MGEVGWSPDYKSEKKPPFIGGVWSQHEGAALNRYYDWLLAEARWFAEGARVAEGVIQVSDDGETSYYWRNDGRPELFPWESENSKDAAGDVTPGR